MNYYFKKYLSTPIYTTIICMSIFAPSSAYPKNEERTITEKLNILEKSADGRLGISATDTTNGIQVQHYAQTRFPMCSTVKLMAAAAILKKSMTENNLLQQKIHYKKSDISAYSPITQKHINDGMTVAELCAAAIQYSDNTAFDLLVKVFRWTQCH